MLREILTNKKNKPVATLLADKVGDKIKIGWSYHSDDETWEEEYGTDVAKVRMEASDVDYTKKSPIGLPHIVGKRVDKFTNRAVRYFRWLDNGGVPKRKY